MKSPKPLAGCSVDGEHVEMPASFVRQTRQNSNLQVYMTNFTYQYKELHNARQAMKNYKVLCEK